MIYDTLKLADQLEHEAGFDAPRARAMAHIMAETAGGNLATRDDILLAKAELRAEIQAVKGGLSGEILDMKGDVRVLYWISGTTLAGVAALLGIAITVALHVTHLG